MERVGREGRRREKSRKKKVEFNKKNLKKTWLLVDVPHKRSQRGPDGKRRHWIKAVDSDETKSTLSPWCHCPELC